MRSSATSDLGATPRSVFSGNCQNLGFTDVAIMRRRAAELEISNLEKIRTQTQVGADVVASYETRQAAARQIEDARETFVEAIESLQAQLREHPPGSPARPRDSPHRGLAADPGAGPGPPRLPRFCPAVQPRPVPAQTRHRPAAAGLERFHRPLSKSAEEAMGGRRPCQIRPIGPIRRISPQRPFCFKGAAPNRQTAQRATVCLPGACPEPCDRLGRITSGSLHNCWPPTSADDALPSVTS